MDTLKIILRCRRRVMVTACNNAFFPRSWGEG